MSDSAIKMQTRPGVRDVTPIRRASSAAAMPTRSPDWFSDAEQMFDSFLPRGALSPFRRDLPLWSTLPAMETRMPRIDVLERDNDIVVCAELPGVEKDMLDISLTDDSVTIKTETRSEEKGNYYRCEITHGSFQRTVALPEAINTEQAKASLKNGLLELTCPKLEKAKRRSIKVE